VHDSPFLLLTPALDGADGISALSRLVVRAIGQSPEVWTLCGGAGAVEAEVWSAGGSRTRFVSRAVRRAATPLGGLTVIVTHLHLAPIARLLNARGARVVQIIVGIESWRRLRARERRALEQADRVVAISHHTERLFRRANPQIVLPNGMVVCHPAVPDAGEGPAPADEGFALIVARMWAEERYKGHDQLIDIWPAVRAQVPEATLVIAGEGNDRARLERRVAGAGLQESIRFTGRVSDAALARLYASCRCLVLPSASEGFGLVYLEAMRAGKPCIALHGAADEILSDGVDGLLVDADRSGLAGAVVRLLGDAACAARMGAAARRTVATRFSEQAFRARFCAAIRRLVPAS
jgi:phosphatidylinositol alpha-1,6-mannosyltransferase